MKYVIAWQSRRTGATGKGSTVFPLPEAWEWCNKLNEAYPDLDHWPEAADADAAPLQDEPDPEWSQQDEDNHVYWQITK